MPRSSKAADRRHAEYEAIIAAGAAGLAPDEFWVIDHDDGPIWYTASKRLDVPVLIFCEAMNCDWDEATESGFRLNRLVLPARLAG